MELRGLEPLAFWMQTSGTTLVAVEGCSLVRTWMPAYGSRSAYGLLYLAAVHADWREHEDHQLANMLSKPARLGSG